jgi:hypothetical protein
MNLNAVQLVHPIGLERGTLRAVAGRVGRVALLYGTIAGIGAALTLFSFLLTWHNVVLAVAGVLVGLTVVRSSAMFVEMLVLLIREFKYEVHSFRKAWSKLGRELERVARDRDLTGALRDELLVLVRHGGLIAVAVIVYLISHESVVLHWSGLTGVYVGAAIVVIVRVIFHTHLFGVRRDR